MNPTNGQSSELQAALERIVAAFARINNALRTLLEKLVRLFESHEASSGRREKEFEIIREKVESLKQRLEHAITLILESKGDIERVRDHTPIHGVPLYDPAQDKRPDDKSGPAIAIHGGKVRFALSSSWVGTVLKLAVSVVGGGVGLRVIQWLANGK